jgi:hypothetical protein
MRSSIAKRCALIAVILVIEFAILEAGLYMFGDFEAGAAFQSLFVTDPRVGHVLRPGADVRYTTSEFDTQLTINAQGVRDDQPIGPAAAGERRILILGDSYVFAVQVPFRETMGERLEARLNETATGHRWRVINGGVQGYGPVEQWLFYRNIGAAFEPDVVLIMVSVATDAIEAFDSRVTFEAGRVPRGTNADVARSRMRQVIRSSAVLQLARRRYDQLRARMSTAVAERPLATYLHDPPADVVEGIELATRAFGRIAEEASRRGARVAFVLMPARFQTNDPEFEQLSKNAADAGGRMDRHVATERFSRALTPLGYPILDLLPVYSAADGGRALHFVRNSHLTPHGHQVTADAMLQLLRTHGIVRALPR